MCYSSIKYSWKVNDYLNQKENKGTKIIMKYYEDFLRLEVFNFEEANNIVGKKENTKVLLSAYVKKGLIKRVHRNLYSVVRLENKGATADRYLIGSKTNKNSFLAYHSAFELHGLSHQVNYIVYVASERKISDFEFEGVLYKYVGTKSREGVIRHRMNEKIRFTELERTVVDSIDRLEYCGGPYELDEILKICPVVDEGKIMKYAQEYNKKILYKKLGFFLERNSEALGISNQFLNILERSIGASKKYLSEEVINGDGTLVTRWDLIVPKTFIGKGDLFV